MAHYKTKGYDWLLFVRLADANWNTKEHRYDGIRTIARTMGLSPLTITKHLARYNTEIGRK